MKKALITAAKILTFFIGWAVLAGVIEIPFKEPAVWRFFAELIPFAVMIVFTVVFLLIEKKEVKIPILKGGLSGTIVGTITGALWIGSASAILIASHQLTVTSHKNVSYLWLWIVSAFINVIMQELLTRGYIYQLLKTRYNTVLAVIVTTALFTFMHGGAFEAGVIPVINVVTMCLFTTALYEYSGTIISPIMAHAVWNILGAIVLGGVSLAEDYPSICQMTASDNKLLSGGKYKIEASIVVLIINIVLMALFCFLSYKKNKKLRSEAS